MAAFDGDWAFLREALPLLRDYVLSRDVSWPIRVPGYLQAPQLSIGSMQLSLARLSALPLDSKAQAERENLRQRIQQVRDEWRTNWGNKSAKEYESRLNLWQQYVHDLLVDPRGHAASYASEVRQRAILRLLVSELNNSPLPDQADRLALLDQSLRGASHLGPFVWEVEVQASFPTDDFWFLYVKF